MGLGVKEASLHLDHKLLHLMDQLEDLEIKREKLNSLIEEVLSRIYINYLSSLDKILYL